MGLLDFLPFFSLAIFGLAATPLGLVKSRRIQVGLGPTVGLVGLAIGLGSAVWLGFRTVQTPLTGPPPVISTDLFTYFFTGVLISVSIFVGVASLTFMKGDQN